MAVQKSRVTRSRRNQRRRSKDAFSPACLGVDQETGEVHIRHHVSETGFYKGKQMIKSKVAAEDSSSDSGIDAK